MNEFDDLPVPEGPDPIESSDLDSLRSEILRLRESLLAANGRAEVLRDRIEALERRETELDAINTSLHEELEKSFQIRVRDAVRNRLPGQR